MEQEVIEITVVISGILFIIIIICFFVLCSNVGKIKNTLKKLYLKSGYSSDEKIDRLYDLIKKNFFGSSNKQEILDILNGLINSKESALVVIEKYNQMYAHSLYDDLINILKNLSTNHDVIREYLSCFIEYNIVENEYPHDLIK